MSTSAIARAPAQFPAKLQFLFEPSRYKVIYGGRGAGRSWGCARSLLLQGVVRPLRVLCAREMQNSIRDSVHKLLSDQIEALGLGHLYDIQQSVIRGSNGTEFSFEGIRHNIAKIKSYEGVDICWAEEADAVSKGSWDILIPTIRKQGSEIWVTFNPKLESDETYQRFVKNPPANCISVKTTWADNPWFPETLKTEMLDLKARDYDAFRHVWEGECRVMLDGAVYAHELRDARETKRICKVPYDHTKPVSTFWDLGWADNTSIWFAQIVGFETRIIDFYQNRQRPLDHYLGELQRRGYIYDTLWLPHDAKAHQYGTGRTIEELTRSKGFRTQIVPRVSLTDGINAGRTIFPNCFFDENKCADGLQALMHYKYELVGEGEEGKFAAKPAHDHNSHAADAFRYLALALRSPKSRGLAGLVDSAKRRITLGDTSSTHLGWLS